MLRVSVARLQKQDTHIYFSHYYRTIAPGIYLKQGSIWIVPRPLLNRWDIGTTTVRTSKWFWGLAISFHEERTNESLAQWASQMLKLRSVTLQNLVYFYIIPRHYLLKAGYSTKIALSWTIISFIHNTSGKFMMVTFARRSVKNGIHRALLSSTWTWAKRREECKREGRTACSWSSLVQRINKRLIPPAETWQSLFLQVLARRFRAFLDFVTVERRQSLQRKFLQHAWADVTATSWMTLMTLLRRNKIFGAGHFFSKVEHNDRLPTGPETINGRGPSNMQCKIARRQAPREVWNWIQNLNLACTRNRLPAIDDVIVVEIFARSQDMGAYVKLVISDIFSILGA